MAVAIAPMFRFVDKRAVQKIMFRQDQERFGAIATSELAANGWPEAKEGDISFAKGDSRLAGFRRGAVQWLAYRNLVRHWPTGRMLSRAEPLGKNEYRLAKALSELVGEEEFEQALNTQGAGAIAVFERTLSSRLTEQGKRRNERSPRPLPSILRMLDHSGVGDGALAALARTYATSVTTDDLTRQLIQDPSD